MIAVHFEYMYIIIIIIVIFFIRSNPSRQGSTISLWGGGQEKRKNKKTRKSKRKEIAVGFSSASPLSARKQEEVTHGGTIEPGGMTT